MTQLQRATMLKAWMVHGDGLAFAMLADDAEESGKSRDDAEMHLRTIRDMVPTGSEAVWAEVWDKTIAAAAKGRVE